VGVKWASKKELNEEKERTQISTGLQ